jgi:uncharacterized small protein (DUF1192 family)
MLIEDEDHGPTPLLAKPPLDRLGVAELRAYIEGLRAEIARAEAEAARKETMRNAADSVFRFK